MMRPFKPGDRLEDHAVPIGEVMQQLQTQMAEYRALKEQMAGNGNAGIPAGSPPFGGTPIMHAADSNASNDTSSSSSFLSLSGATDSRSLDTPRNSH
jgi:adenylate cyclase